MISFLSNRFWGEDLLFIACPTHRFLPAGIKRTAAVKNCCLRTTAWKGKYILAAPPHRQGTFLDSCPKELPPAYIRQDVHTL